MTADEFELLGELEDEFAEEAMELEPFYPRRPARYRSSALSALNTDSAEYERLDFPAFESDVEIAQKKLLNFREEVHLRPHAYKKLILSARFDPFPERSNFIGTYTVPNSDSLSLLTLVIDAFGLATQDSRDAYDQILHELRGIADRKFGPEIAAEQKLLVAAAKNIASRLNRGELKGALLDAAMLDPQKLQTDPADLSTDFRKLGSQLDKLKKVKCPRRSKPNWAIVSRSAPTSYKKRTLSRQQ